MSEEDSDISDVLKKLMKGLGEPVTDWKSPEEQARDGEIARIDLGGVYSERWGMVINESGNIVSIRVIGANDDLACKSKQLYGIPHPNDRRKT
ncbi:hypothetical protein GF343_03270 [Candidatus Woesearchaeota archaeon]|nr:hypothetical protein [Candidatus Woesearchaeota archaeon]